MNRSLARLTLFVALVFGAAFTQAGSLDDFFVAVHRNDPATLQALVNRGFDPNSFDEQGEPALVKALKLGSLEAAKVLMNAPRVKLNATNQLGENALMMASLQGRLSEVRALIEKGADVNKSGWTPLHYASSGTSPAQSAIVDALLRDYAYIDAPSPNGSTPLMMAAKYASSALVKQLLEEGADPALRNQLGLSAVDFANQAHRADVAKMIQRVIDDTPTPPPLEQGTNAGQ